MWPFSRPSSSVTRDQHVKALELTAAELSSPQAKEIRELARRLEIPVEVVTQTYHSHLSAMEREAQRIEMASADTELEIRSTGKDYRPVEIRPDEIYEVTVRPQWVAFRPRMLEIGAPGDGISLEMLEAEAAMWKIHSFRIGGKEQLDRGGPISAAQINELIAEGFIKPETAQTAMEITLLVQNLADKPKEFRGKFYGTAAI